MKDIILFKGVFYIQLLLSFISGCLPVAAVKCSSKQYNDPDADCIGCAFFDHFENDRSGNWYRSGVWSNGGVFNCEWHPEQINYTNDNSLSVLTLTLDKNDWTSNSSYNSAEIRTNERYGYGLYESKMKPVVHVGVVSSFFVFTNNDHMAGNPWDEIDIEFIKSQRGIDPTQIMQCNFFTKGRGNNEYAVKLDFDATSSYHVYAFKWEPNKITWYIDGIKVHSVSGENIPNHAGKIMMNLWPTIKVDSWCGKYNGKVPLTAYCDWVRFTPLDSLPVDQ